MRSWISLITPLLFLAGCHAPNVTLTHGRVDLVVQPVLAAGYSAQAEVGCKSADSIKRLDILPYVQTGTNVFHPISSVTGEASTAGDPDQVKLSQTAPSIDFDHPVTLRNLRANTTYRIFGQAYDESNVLISTTDAYSYVEITVGTDNTPQLPVKLPLKLLDTPFSAATTISLNTSGALNRLSEVTSGLYALVNDAEVPVGDATLTILPNAFPRTVSLSHLQANTTYRLKAHAKDSGGSPLTSGAVDIPVTTNDTPASQTMTLIIPEFPLVARVRS